ncbi:hypothetical protein EON67_09020, partial [archaeon]
MRGVVCVCARAPHVHVRACRGCACTMRTFDEGIHTKFSGKEGGLAVRATRRQRTLAGRQGGLDVRAHRTVAKRSHARAHAYNVPCTCTQEMVHTDDTKRHTRIGEAMNKIRGCVHRAACGGGGLDSGSSVSRALVSGGGARRHTRAHPGQAHSATMCGAVAALGEGSAGGELRKGGAEDNEAVGLRRAPAPLALRS